ncbi:bifunctional hydroxymethylpyrimidine kinase/phosphomethylpyrimidine kinase [Luteococcus peritonei]|uniref:Bifunctional hydroxymethylpyrimidine kinase/phosphomethylpyrimidine kinase n=1 Tax=Luteococcus peritonei TaxID=88874 RepID=A0ABW4RXN8_9ACTN
MSEALRGPLTGVPVVLDPVMVATSGDSLAAEGVREAIVELLAHCSLVTPNLPEAAGLTGEEPASDRGAMARQAQALLGLGAPAVLLKGGHLGDDGDQVWDLVARRGPDTSQGPRLDWLDGPRVRTRNTHGTGCTLSSAVAANLAHGLDLVEACRRAKEWLARALASSEQLSVGDGSGHGPVNHLEASWVTLR